MMRVNLSPSVQQQDWRCCSETGSYVHPTLGSNSPPSFRHAVITGVHPPHPGNRCASTTRREQVGTHCTKGTGAHPPCPGNRCAPTMPREQVCAHHTQETGVRPLHPGNGCAPTMPRGQVCTHHTQGTGVCPPHPGKSPLHTNLPIEKTMEHPAGENTAPLVLSLEMSTISAEHRAASAADKLQGSFEARPMAGEDRVLGTPGAAGEWPSGLSTCGFSRFPE